jgi:hypothetical protein
MNFEQRDSVSREDARKQSNTTQSRISILRGHQEKYQALHHAVDQKVADRKTNRVKNFSAQRQKYEMYAEKENEKRGVQPGSAHPLRLDRNQVHTPW